MTERIIPGDITIESISIISSSGKRIEIKNLLIQIDLFESIMSPFITGSITLTDSIGLSDTLHMMGEELLLVDMISPVTKTRYTKEFFIYKMTGRENLKMKNALYTLHFASVEFFTDINTKISRKYNGKVSDLAKNLITSSDGLRSRKQVLVEESTNKDIFVSNFWTPTQIIYYLSSRATNSYGNPSFVFFEANEGFVFASLEKLYTQPLSFKFVRDQKTREPSGTIDLAQEYRQILDLSTPDLFDYIDRNESGFYGGATYRYDLTSKTLNFRYLIARDDLKSPRMNKNLVESTKQVTFDPMSNIRHEVIHKQQFSGSTNLTVNHDLRRMATLKRLESIRTNIQVFGLFDYSVGKKYELDITKDTTEYSNTTDDVAKDNILSGNYLVTSLHHNITRESHICNLELSKESFDKDIYTEK